MKTKTFPLVILIAATIASAQQLKVDSVSVDTVWNSDSSWYDGQGILQQRYSRDLFLSFKPMGGGMAQCFVALSIDSTKTWAPSPNPLTVLDNGITSIVQCRTKGRVKLRVLGQDRAGVAFRVTARQWQPIIAGNPKLDTMGLTTALTPGASCSVNMQCSLKNASQELGFATIAKVWWDALGDGIWDDSSTALSYTWLTTVPQGTSGQRRAMVAKARDSNGLWSAPCTLTVQFGPLMPGQPVLSSPSNNATGLPITPLTLAWSPGSGGPVSSYALQVSTNTGFNTTVWDESNITGVRKVLNANLTSYTTYYWHVNATNIGGTSAWSSIWGFTTFRLPAMANIPAGTFQMGSTNTSLGATPVHSVVLGAFTMSQTLVTQEQYQAVMGSNPAYFDSGSSWPVERVRWYDAALFCNALSKLAGKDTVYTYTGTMGASVVIDYTKNGYRLPTEAEYEYANRAGTTTDYYWGRNYPPTTHADTLAIDSNAVWYYNSPNSTQPVATKKPNAWGLYDMSGNLWEWCNDWYGSYSASSQTNPTGATSASGYRVLRGGSWYDINGYVSALSLCAAYRNNYIPDPRNYGHGFRVVCGAR